MKLEISITGFRPLHDNNTIAETTLFFVIPTSAEGLGIGKENEYNDGNDA